MQCAWFGNYGIATAVPSDLIPSGFLILPIACVGMGFFLIDISGLKSLLSLGIGESTVTVIPLCCQRITLGRIRRHMGLPCGIDSVPPRQAGPLRFVVDLCRLSYSA